MEADTIKQKGAPSVCSVCFVETKRSGADNRHAETAHEWGCLLLQTHIKVVSSMCIVRRIDLQCSFRCGCRFEH